MFQTFPRMFDLGGAFPNDYLTIVCPSPLGHSKTVEGKSCCAPHLLENVGNNFDSSWIMSETFWNLSGIPNQNSKMSQILEMSDLFGKFSEIISIFLKLCRSFSEICWDVPEVLCDHEIPSEDARITPDAPTATNMLFPYVILIKLRFVPEVLDVQSIPLDELRIVQK